MLPHLAMADPGHRALATGLATLGLVHLGATVRPYVPPPGSVVFDSSEGASEFRSTMGLYEPVGAGEGPAPQQQERYYLQKEGEWIMVYNDAAPVTDKYGNEVGTYFGQWEVQLVNDSSKIPLKAKADSSRSPPPTDGWTYEKVSGFHFLSFSAYKVDPSLSLLPAGRVGLPECESVTVSSSGPAGSLYPGLMGQYGYNGRWKDGHPVFVNDGGDRPYHLATGRRQGRWYIAPYAEVGDRVADPGDVYDIASGRASLSPANPATAGQTPGWIRRSEAQKKREELEINGQDTWVYYDAVDDLFKQDDTIKVECNEF